MPLFTEKSLTEQSLPVLVQELANRDVRLAAIVNTCGSPPLWAREQGFPTLVQIILEQQVSLASAKAAFDKLSYAASFSASSLTPERFLTFDVSELKAIGFSRQKTRYVRHLAELLIQERLNLDALPTMSDDAVRTALMQVKGIGAWTADIYLLMALGRPDIFPTGDLALQVAAQRVYGLANRPSPQELEDIGEAWRPHRAVAARILWHFYLSDSFSVQDSLCI